MNDALSDTETKPEPEDRCEFYPMLNDDPVCACGSDISGKFICTKEYSEICQWAIAKRAQEKKGKKHAL